ncbi:MAG: septum formation inhibitor [Bacteroidales bacterium]|nr:septum formation inhibitor [Bacteroidales bacterium]
MQRKKLITALKNKYFVAILAFLVWMLFFDGNNLIFQYRLKSSLNQLSREKDFYLSEIDHDKTLLHKLETDTAVLEKFAREKYLMKRKNEDVFLVPDNAGMDAKR